MDAISYLPDEILGDILTLLSTKQAVSTSLLSKKWRNMFKLVPNLDYNGSILIQPGNGKPERGESFKDFLDRRQLIDSTIINKFYLKRIKDKSEMDYVSSWICDVVKRGVLEADINVETGIKIFLPRLLFTSKTLVKLTLGKHICLGNILSDVSLPSLKSLIIDSIVFYRTDLYHELLFGCPMLEELFVFHKENISHPISSIASRTIKRLYVHYDVEIDLRSDMSFIAPRLLSLYYSDYAMKEYNADNLESLVEARLDIRYSEISDKPDLMGLINGIGNVENLHLTSASTDVSDLSCVERGLVLPVFNNLVILSFGGKNKRGWKLLPYLLKQSSKLETLIIKDLDSYTSDGYIPLNQVKVLHVLGYRGTAQDLERLKSFLRGTNCLKLVRVEMAEGFVMEEAIVWQTHRDLMTLLGVAVSSKCKTEVAHFIQPIQIFHSRNNHM